jgi:hypothetical protein
MNYHNEWVRAEVAIKLNDKALLRSLFDEVTNERLKYRLAIILKDSEKLRDLAVTTTDPLLRAILEELIYDISPCNNEDID